MPVYAAVSWLRLSGVAKNLGWTEQRAIRGEGGGLILSESGAPLIMESGGLGDAPAATLSWVKPNTPLPPNWTVQEAITGEGGGLILGEGGAPLIMEGPEVGGIALPPPIGGLVPSNVLTDDVGNPLTDDGGNFLVPP